MEGGGWETGIENWEVRIGKWEIGIWRNWKPRIGTQETGTRDLEKEGEPADGSQQIANQK